MKNLIIPFRVKPMLASAVPEPFHRAGWIYEEKYDGDRMIAYKEGRRVRLFSRSAIDRTAEFPLIAARIRNLWPATLLLDGEIVVFDRKAVSRFQLLQQRKGKPVYAIFDCLFRGGEDYRDAPLFVRRTLLEESVSAARPLMLSRQLAKNGLAAFEVVKRRGYEGLVAKRLDSPYHAGRSTDWLKVKARHEDEFLIIGVTKPRGAREYFGALLLAVYEGSKLRYVGKVGTGFDAKSLAALHDKFRPLVRRLSAVSEDVNEPNVTFLAPRLVAQVSYREWTADMKLRQPVFLGLRSDKRPEEIQLPELAAS